MHSPQSKNTLKLPISLLVIAFFVGIAITNAYYHEYFSRVHQTSLWNDGHYNILRALYLIHGFSLYDQIITNHFPGYISLLSIFYEILGLRFATPSPALLHFLEQATLGFVSFLQIVTIYAALRTARIAKVGTSAVTAAFIGYLFWEGYGFYMPIVETFVSILGCLQVVLLYRLFCAQTTRDSAHWGICNVGLIAFQILCSLTYALTLTFWGGVVLILLFESGGLRSVKDWPIKWLSLLVVFVVYVFMHVDVSEMLYWGIKHNQITLSVNVLDNLKLRLFHPPIAVWAFGLPQNEDAFRQFPVIGQPVIVFALAILSGFLIKGKKGKLFALSILVGAYLVSWRDASLAVSIKQLPLVGIGMGLAFVCIAQGPAYKTSWNDKTQFTVRAGTLPVLMLGGMLCILLSDYLIHRRVTEPRSVVLDQSHVCRLNDKPSNCYCALQAFYDPRQFITFDMRPCVGYSPDHPHNVEANIRSRNEYAHAIHANNIAFLMDKTPENMSMYSVNDAMQNEIKATRQCHELDKQLLICTPSSDTASFNKESNEMP